MRSVICPWATVYEALIPYVKFLRLEQLEDSVDELILSVDRLPLTHDGLAQAAERLAKRRMVEPDDILSAQASADGTCSLGLYSWFASPNASVS
jgi:hypothetical protein